MLWVSKQTTINHARTQPSGQNTMLSSRISANHGYATFEHSCFYIRSGTLLCFWQELWVQFLDTAVIDKYCNTTKPLGNYTNSVVIQQLVPSTTGSTCRKNRQFYLLIGTQSVISVWKDTLNSLFSTKGFTKLLHDISIYNGDRQTEKQGQGEKINNNYAIL